MEQFTIKTKAQTMRRPKKKIYDYKQALRENEKQKKVVKKDLSPKDEIKEMFYNWFKKHHKVGQVMSDKMLFQILLQNLIKDKTKF